MALHLISRWLIRESQTDEAELALQQFEKMAMEEPGTLVYLIHRPLNDPDLVSDPTPYPNEVLFFEVYADKPAFQHHVERQQEYLRSSGMFKCFVTPASEPMKTAEMVEFLHLERGFIKKI
ncbi:MAG: antibiotic biosynthesis monooxygenase [Flavobacteriales bacterium]|nr:antibiotic biosynthesis monooxygenase [Flavobacteriales bacterium]